MKSIVTPYQYEVNVYKWLHSSTWRYLNFTPYQPVL